RAEAFDGDVRDRARRARGTRRPERIREDDLARDDARPPACGGRILAPWTRRRARLLLAAGRGAGRAGDHSGLRTRGDRPPPAGGAIAAGALLVLGLAGAAETGNRTFGW